MSTKVCTTSKANVANDRGSVSFPCPQCGYEIVRSVHVRKIVSKYTCPQCEFEGPN